MREEAKKEGARKGPEYCCSRFPIGDSTSANKSFTFSNVKPPTTSKKQPKDSKSYRVREKKESIRQQLRHLLKKEPNLDVRQCCERLKLPYNRYHRYIRKERSLFFRRNKFCRTPPFWELTVLEGQT